MGNVLVVLESAAGQLRSAVRPAVEAVDVDALEALGFAAEAALCRV